MHAIRLHEFGPAENLVYEHVPDPKPGPGQVRIAVAASGVHLIDTSIRRGDPAGPYSRPQLPQIPGREVAGSVDAVGDGVDPSWIGRRVVAHLGPASGGYAELAVRDVDAVHTLPDELADQAAVTMIGTGRTTVAILDAAQLAPDDVAIVTAAAGGIGSLLVQAARNLGATVVGLAGGAEKVDRVRSGGTDVAIDYTDPDWPAAVREALGDRAPTIALDGVGGSVGRGALELLGPGGRLLLFGWSSGTPTEVTTADLFQGSLTATAAIGPAVGRRPGGIRALEEQALAAAAAGRLTPVVNPPFALADAAAAHAALESRATVGKVVLLP